MKDSQDQPSFKLPNQDLNLELSESEEVCRLKAELQRYRTLSENLPVGYFTLSSEGIILTVNSFAATHLGYGVEELTEQSIFNLTHPEDREQLQANLKAIFENPIESCDLEGRQISKDGNILWMRTIAHALPENELILICEDVTQRKQVENELRSTKSVLEYAVEGISRLDEQGRYIAVNRAYAGTLGYTPEEMIGREWYPTVHPEDQEKMMLAYQQMLIEGKVKVEAKGVRKDGSVFYKQLVMVTAFDSQNQFIGHHRFMKDITERKQAEAALQKAHDELERRVEERTAELTQANALLKEEIAERRRAEEERQKLASLVENSTDFIAMSSLEGKIIFLNEAGQKLVGLDSLEAALAKQMSDYFSEEGWAQFCEVTLPAILTTGHWEGEGQLRHFKTGKLIDVQRSCFVVKHPQTGKSLCLATVQCDITERKQAEIALRQQTEREKLLGLISPRIRHSLNLNEILNTTVGEVREFLETDRVFIYRFESDWSGVIVVESVGSGWTPILGTKIKDCYFAETYVEPYRNGRIQATDDIYAAGFSECHIDLLAKLQVRATLVVPVLQGDQLWGLLVVNHCCAPRQWQTLEIDLIKRLATQVGIAIQQSELYQQVQLLNVDLESQVQERTRQLQQALNFESMLKRVTDHVRDSLDESQILQTAVEDLTEVLGIDGCDTALYDPTLATAMISYEYTPRLSPAKGRIIRMADFPEGYRQLLQGQYFQFCELSPSLREPLSILACPIFDNKVVLGDMWLFKQQDDGFNELEIRLVQQVANQCAIAIRQARLFQAAQAQVEELEKLNRLKDDFLNTISHELRTPMSNIKMAMQMLEISINQQKMLEGETSKAQAATPPTFRYFKILQDESEREISLINDLLDLQQLDAGTQPLMLTTIHLQNWISHVIEPFEQRFCKQQQILHVEIASDLPPLVSDMSALGRILSELLNNACKYTPPQGEITVTARVESGMLQLGVSNTGIEIPASEFTHIFDKFYRIPSADPWKQGGTGLGLALAHKLAEHLGGRLWVESGKDRTCFTLELPVTGETL
ncbi:PAS domain S-box protein [Microcoleus sp. FACHB-672]|uniref:PAS domain S-box protein n=1 Tax=Microcoleus sp. FACHB-672 TaxID=2692825 RepID=UPI001684BBA6|nr:PAS domain S-box protein [Microcoleus sp. FACHB-672]MBD2041443.1 PAS domain S-box protein [Microcoleus sp. FACHB-672]